MRKIIIILSILYFHSEVTAQKVTFKKDTIYKDGKPYGLIKAKGSAILGQDYSLQTLNGKELVFFKLEGDGTHNYYKVLFRETGQKTYVPVTETRKSLAREIVMNDMISEDGINPEGEKRFLQIYDKDLSVSTHQPTPQENNNQAVFNYQMIERERKGEMKVFGFNIQQNFTDIGTYEKDRDASREAYIFVIQLPDGTKIAEAVLEDNSQECKIVTRKDNKMHRIYLNKTNFDSEVVEQIATFLVERYYL